MKRSIRKMLARSKEELKRSLPKNRNRLRHRAKVAEVLALLTRKPRAA